MELFAQFGIDIGYFCIGLAGFALFLFLLFIILLVRQNKLIKRYRVFMKGDKDVVTMEQMIEDRLADMDRLENKSDALTKKIMEIDDTLLGTYQKTAIVKYDAFRGMGGNLSFVLAMLDKNNSGFLLNSMHSKESCYTYIKDVRQGKTRVELSEEEKEALQEAISRN